ncbi:MAG: FKBP-type peptidyl-prolyl cis-trans isomerase, partial [Candidatus Micrarchaeaceae archaeon]
MKTQKMPQKIKPQFLAVIAAAIIAIAAIAYFVMPPNLGLAVADGDNISVYYTGMFTNGTVFSTNLGQAPLHFVVGSNEVIPGFSQAVIGMHVNQTKTAVLQPSEAYGNFNPNLIVRIPISSFGNRTVQNG